MKKQYMYIKLNSDRSIDDSVSESNWGLRNNR